MSPSRRPGNARAPWPCVIRPGNGEYRPTPRRAPRRWRGGAMGTSRPTATGPHHGARAGRTKRDRATGYANIAPDAMPPYRTGARRPRDPGGAHGTGARRAPPVPCALAPIGTKGSGFSAPNEDFRRISEQDDTVTVALRSGQCYSRCVAYLDRIVVWIGDP